MGSLFPFVFGLGDFSLLPSYISGGLTLDHMGDVFLVYYKSDLTKS